MKKQKVISIEKEQLNNLDLDAIHKLQEGLNQIHQFPVYTPELQWFEQMVLEERKKTRKKLVKDLSIFILVALLILSGIILSLFRMPVVFILLQIITTTFIAIYSILVITKKVHNV